MNIAVVDAGSPPCPVCRARTRVVAEGLYDDRYGYPDVFAQFECDACGHRTIPTNFSSDDLTRLYTQYYPRGNFDLDQFRPEIEKKGFFSWLAGDRSSAFRWVPRNVRVLDIGCGLGTTLAYHRNRGCHATGIEADANVQAVASRYGLDIKQGVFDGSQFESASFDFVTLDQVAEHVVDPHVLLKGVARVLKPGGTAIITTPNPKSFGVRLFGRKWINWHVPYHIQFYTPKSLALVAEEAGLKLVRHKTITPTVWQLFQWYHVLAFPVRGGRHPFWTTGQAPAPRWKRAVVALLKELDIHVWVSRALDLIGMGDNHVFILRKP
jgi:SAM-dependent methyltransferase